MPMPARSPDEHHRASTPLELFFDLVFVVAIAQAAAGLHRAVLAHQIGHGLLGFTMVFFAIWWAWMNFTWFASAYDPDDTIYRITVLVQLTGALILAAGLAAAFDRMDFTAVVVGYVVMRVAMVSQWLRAARHNPEYATSAKRNAIGITILQLGWIGMLAVPSPTVLIVFIVLALGEFAVPIWAERHRPTPWHAGHITERYGLFTIIVLGESILAATLAIQAALAAGTALTSLLTLIVGGLLIVYSAWWLYFDDLDPARMSVTSLRRGFVWAYGHALVFAATAAIGAGLAIAVDQGTGHTAISLRTASFAIAIPVALFLTMQWLLNDLLPVRPVQRPWLLPFMAVLVLLTPFGPAPASVMGLLMVAAVGLR
ncbi:MAG: low temperature requirement protein A [Gemmatimonadota bacterium]